MVILRKERDKLMGMERSEPLHNFKMPCLKWGNQRLLRCINDNPTTDDSSSGDGPDRRCSAPGVEKGLIGRRRKQSEVERWGWIDRRDSFKKSLSPSPVEIDGNEGIEAVREKLMFDLQAAADKMKFTIFRKGSGEPPPAPANASDAVRPWNLRTRRTACKSPNRTTGGGCSGGGAKSLKIDEMKPNFSPLRTEKRALKLRGGDVTATATNYQTGEKRERKKFSVSLSRREIEEDFISMVGHRPPRRPRKRVKIVQKQLDLMFPGFWLTEVTADMYKVCDVTATGKIY